jgi:orotidine-5'-phosphate decarboxylase
MSLASRTAGPAAGAGRLVVALDVPRVDAAVALTRELAGRVGGFKVGLELFHAEGPGIFAPLRAAGAERIWYDGKFHDIPNTVGRTARALAPHSLWMLNVHVTAGREAMAAVRQAAEEGAAAAGGPRPLVLGVTLLTSLSPRAVAEELGMTGSVEANVVRLARLAQASGLDGVVASPLEAAAVRAACGPGFLIVTPGVRSAAAQAGDQRRVATPAAAIQAGADYLVIGREITASDDPRGAAERLATEVAGAVG